jgi:hypothetical protein
VAQWYYRDAANLNKNILQAIAKAYSDFDEYRNIELDEQTPPQDTASPLDQKLSTGEYIRRHLYLLKLALQRHWEPLPVESDQYYTLSKHLFEMFPKELEGAESVEKWYLTSYEASKSEGTDDLLPSSLDDWGLTASK